MSHINRLLILFSLFIICPIKVQAYNIEDALLSAYVKNDTLKSQKEELEIVKLEKGKALTEFMPSVVASTDFSRTTQKLQAFRNQGSRNSRNSTLQVSIDLFTGGSTVAKINMANKSIKASVAQYQGTLNDITYKVIESYQNIIFAREYYQITLHNEEFKKDVLQKANIKFEMGEEVKTAVVKAKAELAAAAAQKEAAFNQIQDATANFVYLVGETPPESMESINTNFIQLPDMLDKLSVAVSNNNPQLIKARNDTDKAKKNIELAFSKLSPTLKFVAQASRSNAKKYIEKEQQTSVKHQNAFPYFAIDPNTGEFEKDRNGNLKPATVMLDTYTNENRLVTVPNPNKRDSNTVMLQLNVPIFQKGLEYVEISEAKKRAKGAEYILRNAEGELNSKSIQAWNKYHSSKHQLDSHKESTVFYEEAVKGEKEKYEAGATTITQLLDIQNDQKEQQIKYLKASHDHKLSMFEIRKLMGDLHKVNYGNNKKTESNPAVKDKKDNKDVSKNS